MNAWILLMLGAGALLAIGSLALVCGILRAPSGFEDDGGFHCEAKPEHLKETAPEVSLSDTHLGHAA